MSKSQLATLLIFIHVSVLIIVGRFYLDPQVLETHCLSSRVSPPPQNTQSTEGIVVDCVACRSSSAGQMFKTRVIAAVGIFVPLRAKQEKRVNLDEPFEFVPGHQKTLLREEFLYKTIALIEKEQKYFECKDLQKLDDFALDSTADGKLLSTGWSILETLAYKDSPVLGTQLIGNNFTRDNYRMVSGMLPVQSQLYSLAVKLRYKVIDEISSEDEPVFLYYSVEETVVVRMLLLGTLLLSLHKVMGMLARYHWAVRIAVGVVLASGFLSSTSLVAASVLTIYLMFGQVLSKRMIGVAIGCIFGGAAVAQNSNQITMLPLSLLVFLILYLINRLQGSSWPSIVGISSASCTILVGLALNWSTLVLVAPTHYLSCILTLYQPGEDKKEAKSSYSGVHSQQLEQEEDMVVRIEKELAHK